MARTVAPLLSFAAGGQIAKTQVYASWKGRPYVRRYVVPSNPNSTDQQLTRSAFKFLTSSGKFMTPEMLEVYEAYAKVSQFTVMNGFIKQNLSNLRSAADLANLVFSPGAASGFPAAGIAATPGADQLSIALTAPVLPPGWSIVYGAAAAIFQQDPNTGSNYQFFGAQDNATPFAIVITGLTGVGAYEVGGWFKYLKPNGDFAYGRAINTTGTPT